MKQATLDLAKRELLIQPLKASIGAMYAQGNRECARIIAKDPVKYEGLMLEWAKLVLAK